MKLTPIDPPREFVVGRGEPIRIRDCARVLLEPDEQVTFVTEGGAEYDLARKVWGFYATPSMNARLSSFGLRAALARSPDQKYYVFLLERGKEADFERYLRLESNEVLGWLDDGDTLARLEEVLRAARAPLSCPCASNRFVLVHRYEAPPEGEVRFAATSGTYRRDLLRCQSCGHFVSVDEMDHDTLYAGDYVDANYGDLEGLRRAFERISGLDPSCSDNVGRVRRILEVAGTSGSVLDVGSGLCVFLHRMKAAGWRCVALDPDERSCRHARETVGVDAIHGDFMAREDLGEYDLITFNKVLEHVRDPVAMLARAARFLKPDGRVYVELPDGEAAIDEGPGREEFFVDHYHVFSMASLALLATRAGFRVETLERLREPSTKFTLRAFISPMSEET